MTTHGLSKTREYRKWKSAKERCYPTAHCRKDYFERGIRMCDEWDHSFLAFYHHIGPCPLGATLDRIENDKGYEPGNVRWTTKAEQNRNRTLSVFLEFNGRRMIIADWARETGLSFGTISYRNRNGWPIEQVLNPNLSWAECVAFGRSLKKCKAA